MQCPFFFWCACPRRRRAMRSPLRDGTVVLKTFHWNVFLTHSTSSAPNEKDTAFAVSFFLLVRLPAQASRYALAFAGRDSRAKNVPLERFFDALHFKRARVWKTPGEQCFFCLVRLPTQAACCALAFVGCRKRAGGSFRSAVPLERFLTHSTSSARGRRAARSFLWEIKLRRKKGAAESSAFFVLVKRSWRFRFAQFNRCAAENVDYFARYSS